MKKERKIHIFGNPFLDFDNLPLKLAPKLKKLFPEVNFVIADPSENIKPVNRELFIIDSVEGIEKVVIIDDLEKIQAEKIYSLHDLDLGFNLKLLRKIGQLKKIKIIGVPMKGKEEEILGQLTASIKNFL